MTSLFQERLERMAKLWNRAAVVVLVTGAMAIAAEKAATSQPSGLGRLDFRQVIASLS